jgi:hypothetical protein
MNNFFSTLRALNGACNRDMKTESYVDGKSKKEGKVTFEEVTYIKFISSCGTHNVGSQIDVCSTNNLLNFFALNASLH